MIAAQPVICFADVGQRFAGTDGKPVVALDGLSFDTGRHEFVAVLGPSRLRQVDSAPADCRA